MKRLSYEFCQFVYNVIASGGIDANGRESLKQIVDQADIKPNIIKVMLEQTHDDNGVSKFNDRVARMGFDDFIEEFDRETYTYGTTPHHVLEARLPFKYKMELNRGDMLKLLELLNTFNDPSEEAAEWALSMRSGILQTIGIEEI